MQILMSATHIGDIMGYIASSGVTSKVGIIIGPPKTQLVGDLKQISGAILCGGFLSHRGVTPSHHLHRDFP